MEKIFNIIIVGLVFNSISCTPTERGICNLEIEDCLPKTQCMINLVNNTVVHIGKSCGDEFICCNKDRNLKTITTPCGLRNRFGVGLYAQEFRKSHDNRFAELAEFPWIVSIEDDSKGKLCTGSLINENVVMTSANCVGLRDPDYFKIRVGAFKSAKAANLEIEEVHRVSRVFLYSQTISKFQPNIALLYLMTPSSLNAYVGTTCLSQSTDNLDMNDCFAVGWSADQSVKDDLSYEEKISIETCPDDGLGRDKEQTANLKCARIAKKIEMGSGVSCRINNTESNYQQVGIVMYNPSRFVEQSQVLLVNVVSMQKWIDQQMKDSEIDDSSYVYSMLQSRAFWLSAAGFGVALGFGVSKC